MSKTKKRKRQDFSAAKSIVKESASGAAGGYLVGRKHSEGGIKVINKSDPSRPVEVQGGEAVITAPALSDNTLHDFEGKKMTKRQILSAINVDAGGVSFAEGGRMKNKIKIRYCHNKQYKFGGKMMEGKDIVSDCGCRHKMERGGAFEQSDQELAEKYHMVQKLRPIYFPDNDIDKTEAFDIYETLGSVVNENDNNDIKFVNSVFGKLAGDRNSEIIFKSMPILSDIVKRAIPIYITENIKSKTRPNVLAFHNYLSKFTIGEREYCARITAFEVRAKKKMVASYPLHDLFVSDIDIIKGELLKSPRSLYRALGSSADTNLINWLEKAKEASLKFRSGGKIKKAEDTAVSTGTLYPPTSNDPQPLKGKQPPHATDLTQLNGEGNKMVPDVDRVLRTSADSNLEKGGGISHKLLDDLSKVKLSAGYKIYEGHPDELLKYVQDQATGLISTRDHVDTKFYGYHSICRIIGDKDLVLRTVAALPQKDKDKVIKAWKGRAIDPDLRKVLKQKTMAEGGAINSGKNTNFTSKGISNEVQHILSGDGAIGEESIIKATANYLRASKTTSANGFNKNIWKQEEKHVLLKYIGVHNLWIENIWDENYISEGAEQKVYLYDSENVVKFNDGIFYSSWLEYLNSLLLHNHYFPPTSYTLIGFFKKDNILFAVVKQPFIQGSPLSDTEIVKSFLSANGFNKKKSTLVNDYYNPEMGIIIEDLHEGNVLIKNKVPYFIDTVFFVTDEDGKVVQFQSGGEMASVQNSLVVVCSAYQQVALTEKKPVNTLSEAVTVCKTYIEDWDLGGSTWTGGQVYDINGKLVAYVSYNGRVWEQETAPSKKVKEITGARLSKKWYKAGGLVGDRKTISLPGMEHVVGNSRAYQHMAKGGKLENHNYVGHKTKIDKHMEQINEQLVLQEKKLTEIHLFALLHAQSIVSSYHCQKQQIKKLLTMICGYQKDIKEYQSDLTGIVTNYSDEAAKLSEAINAHKHKFFERNYSYPIDQYDSVSDEKLCEACKEYCSILKTISGKEAELWGSLYEINVFVITQLEVFSQICDKLSSVKENILQPMGLTEEDVNITGSNYGDRLESVRNKMADLEGQKIQLKHRADVFEDTGIDIGGDVPEGTDIRLQETLQ